jgi:hypothetical protein
MANLSIFSKRTQSGWTPTACKNKANPHSSGWFALLRNEPNRRLERPPQMPLGDLENTKPMAAFRL